MSIRYYMQNKNQKKCLSQITQIIIEKYYLNAYLNSADICETCLPSGGSARNRYPVDHCGHSY